MAKLSRAEIEASIRKHEIWAETIGRLAPKAADASARWVKWIAIALSAYFVAGKDTRVAAVVEVAKSLHWAAWMGWVVAVVCTVGWWQERFFRRRSVARLAERTRILEVNRDPERTSSGLTPLGQNQPQDP